MKRLIRFFSVYFSLAAVSVIACAQMETYEVRTIFKECVSTESSITLSVCENEKWNGISFPQTGTYVVAIPNAAGCDSLVTLDVTVRYGALPGKFAISANDTVYFSKGNLQFCAVPKIGATDHIVKGGGMKKGIWRFAEHQYDYVGTKNVKISENYSGWIDLFGWGTSGNTLNPWYAETSGYPTHSLDGMYINDDWGRYNAIINGGNNPEIQNWFTLSKTEWDYLFNNRINASVLRSGAAINGVFGYILLPDNWSKSIHTIEVELNSDASKNNFTAEQWIQLENEGAVFLPCGGRRVPSATQTYENSSYYWGRNYSGGYGEYLLINSSSSAASYSTGNMATLSYGRSVRLVCKIVN